MSSVQRHFFSLLEFISYSPVIKNRRIHTLPEHSCTAFNRTQRKTYHIIIIIITFSSSVPSDIKAKPVGFISDTSDIKHWSQNTHNKCVYSSVCVCVCIPFILQLMIPVVCFCWLKIAPCWTSVGTGTRLYIRLQKAEQSNIHLRISDVQLSHRRIFFFRLIFCLTDIWN